MTNSVIDNNSAIEQDSFAGKKESSASANEDGEPGESLRYNQGACSDSNSSNGISNAAQFNIEICFDIDNNDTVLSNWLAPQLEKLARLADVQKGYLNILITDDKHMEEYHQQYCNQIGTTDVLTFDMRDDGSQRNAANLDGGRDARPTGFSEYVEGDIIICLDQAEREAAKRNHQVRHELLLYALHGLLHLLGEDDHNESDYQKMHTRENELLQAAGIGAVFGEINK